MGIGESTCASRLYAAPISAGGKALLEASELSQIALERATTAREAVLLMGKLAMEYGYYSADWDPTHVTDMLMGEGGEALTVVDPNEAWMFHILADPSGESAVWVAQRVPDNHVTVCANTFVIRDIVEHTSEAGNDDPKADFLYSDNLFGVAQQMGKYLVYLHLL